MSERADVPTRSGTGLAERLWELWQRGQRPDVRAFLGAAGTLGPADLVAVLRVDQQERWRAGERVPAETYLSAYPELGADPELAFELIYREFLLREEAGERPGLDEFLGRFPGYAERLRQQMELHDALDGDALGGQPTRPGAEPLPGTLTDAPVPAGPTFEGPDVPGYEVVGELGRGGMGVVYQAYDRRRGRMVALKVMQWHDPAGLYRFKQEFRSLAGLSHPNLVTLYELVADGRRWYFTMELLDGVPFLAHVRAGGADRPTEPFTPGEGGEAAEQPPARGLAAGQAGRLREALRQLAEGVRALHGAGVLHRDIKPGNVLVTRDGRVVLLDFGLAAEMDRTGKHLSVQPRILGTIDYMSPEQAASKPVSPASDWYSVGVMLYEALTGRVPFAGSPLDVLLAKQQRDPPAPAELVEGVPEDLNALCVDLMAREPSERPSGEEVLRRLGGSAPDSPAGGLEVPLVGRGRHLEALKSALEETRRGRTVVLAVHGRSGAGKSALVRCFLEGLGERAEAVVLAGRCYEQESVPYKALDSLVDALSRYLEGLPALEAEALLPRDIAALTRLFPVLRRVGAVAHAPRRGGDVSDPQEVRRRAVSALRELLGRLGDRRRVVLTIDDLQWGDADSAALLADLLAPPEPPVLLLLGCYRSEEAESSPCLRAFRQLQGQGGSVEGRELAVEPLTPEERKELVLALLGRSDAEAELYAEVIARQSGGYPFFVHELVQYLQAGRTLERAAGGPAGTLTLHEVLWGRVQQLPEGARRLLEVVAVAGRPVRESDACRAAGVNGEGGQALACLRVGGLVRGSGPGGEQEVETYHDRVRETVVERISDEVRAAHHRRLAEVFESSGGCDPEVLAVHLLGAGEVERAGAYYARAAEQAAEALAFDRAAKLYQLALALTGVKGEEERRLRVRLADALAGSGHGAESAREYLAASRGAPEGERLELQRRAALYLLSSGHVDAGLDALRGVLEAVGVALPATSRKAFWGLAWQRLKLRLRGLGFRRRGEGEVPAGDLLRLDACVAAAEGLSMVDTIQGAYFQSRSLLLALSAGEPRRLASALAIEGAHESIGGSRSRGRARKLIGAAEGLARELGEPYPLGVVSLAKGIASALEGDWPSARALCDEAEGTFREKCAGVMWELGTAHRFALWPLVFMGEVAEIARRLPRWVKEAQERDDLYGVTNLALVARTFVLLAADEPGRARSELREVMGEWSRQGFHVQHMNQMYDEAQIDLYEGDAGSAWRRVEEGWPAIERSHLLRVQQVRIFLGHLRGRCALGTGRVREAGREARALWGERVPWARALARLLYAGSAWARGDREASARLLREGARECESASMRLYAESARRALGGVVGGEEGRELVGKAEGWMRGQGVADPGRMAGLLVAGFGGG